MKLKNIFSKRKPVLAYHRDDGTAWLTIAQSEESAKLVIEGSIGQSFYDESGTTSAQYREALASIPKGKPIELDINSPGGAVGESLSIYNQNRERGNVTCRVTGYALSSASVIALSGVKCVMPKSAIMMIHDPMSQTYGNEEEHLKSVKMLATHAETMADIYAEHSGMSKEECRALMREETWMSGEDAHEMGFTDELDEDPEEDTSAKDKVSAIDFSKFKNVPQAVMALAQISQTTNGAGVVPKQQPAPTGALAVIMNKVQMIALLKTWGVQVDENKVTDQELTELIAKGKPVIADSNAVSRAEFEAMRQRMEGEKKSRIEARLDVLIGEQKLSNDERAVELNLCLADESRLENVLAKRPSQFLAGDPLRDGPRIEVKANFLEQIAEIRKSAPATLVGGDDTASAAARFEYRKQHWGDLMQQAEAMDNRMGVGERPRVGAIGNRTTMSNPAVKYCALKVESDGTMRYLPVAASSYNASLIVDQLADGAIVQLVNVLAPLRVFTRDFMPSPFAPLNTLQIRLVTQGGQQIKTPKSTGTGITTTQTDYEASGDHIVSNVPVTMNEYSYAFQLGAQELMSGSRIEYFAGHALQSLGTNIMTDTLTLLNNFAFTGGALGGSITAHYGTWTWNSNSSSVNDMAVLRAQLGKSSIKNAILDPVLFSKLITVPVANQMSVGMPMSGANSMRNIMGWNEIAETSAWATGQGAGGSTGSFPQPIIGFACNPQAFAVGARLPITTSEGVPGNTLVMSQVTIPGLDMTVAIFSWFSLRYRTLWNSYGVVFGANTADLTAGCIVKSLGI